MATIPTTMRALLKEEEVVSYKMKDMPVPEPEGDEVLIKVDLVAICGSDIALYQWNSVAKVIAKVPFIPGHEATGVVVKLGPTATLSVGQRVAVENHFFCGNCFQCKEKRGDICQKMDQYGHGKGTEHGGCCEYSIVSSKYCYPIKTNITPEEAVMMEPMGVAHNAIEQLEVSGEVVLVLGCGPVGLLATSIAKALGATKVLATDIDENRLNLAKTMGADLLINSRTENLHEVVMRETGGDGIGRMVEVTGADVMINNMFKMLRKGGHVVMIGLPKNPIHIENPLPDIVFKSLQLRTVHGRRIFHSWEECEKLLAEKKVDVKPLISHHLPLSKYEEAFDALFKGKACKIVMDPSQ